ncbi:MAG: glycosyltransferase family 39 protein, partial [Planctomycetota bacterium]
ISIASEVGERRESQGERKICIFLILLIVISSFALRFTYISVPYADQHSKSDGIAASTYMVSRNYLRYGYAETRGLQVLNAQETAPEHWVTYPNHPATFVLLQSLVFHITGGESLWAAKLAPMLAVIGQLLLLYRLVRRKYPAVTALTSVAIYSMWPMSLLYGGHPNYEPFCILSMLIFVDRWLAKKPGQATLATFIGGLFDFTAFYPPFLLAIWGLVNRRGKDALILGEAIKQALLLGVPCVLALVIHFAHISLTQQGQDSITYVWELLRQAGSQDSAWVADEVNFSWPAFMSSQMSFLLAGFGLLGLALSLFGLIRRCYPPGTLLLCSCGLMHMLVFRYHAHVHEFWAVYLAAPLALAAGPGLIALRDLIAPAGRMGLRIGAYTAVLLLMTVAGLLRYLDHQSRIDYAAAEEWAETLNSNLPPESVALLVRQDAPLPRGIECLSEDLAVWGFLAPTSATGIDLMGTHLRQYGLQGRRVFAVLEEKALRDYEEENGAETVRLILEARELNGIRQPSFASKGGELRFHCWDITERIFR